MSDLQHQLLLIADQLRGIATLGKRFADSPYDAENAHTTMELAAQLAALATGEPAASVRETFLAEPWQRVSPIIGVEAAVLDAEGALLLVRRKDNGGWTIPGGIAEIGQTLGEGALRELWEEAGLRGDIVRLLGIFDGGRWGTRSRSHEVHAIFLVTCPNLHPVPGMEMTEARFFAPDALPPAEEMHAGHELRVPRVIALARSGETYCDPASSMDGALPMFQRPDGWKR